MTTNDANEVKHMLAVAFAEGPIPVLDESTREERKRRAVSGIQEILASHHAPKRGIVTRITWGGAAAALAMAAGLALMIGHFWPDSARTPPVLAFHATGAKGPILCDRDDGENWTLCNPSESSGVVGLRTLDSASVSIETASGIKLELGASSTLLMSDPKATRLASRVTLTEGRVDVVVPKLGQGRQFSVSTPSATVTVHGTQFSVAVKKNANQAFETCVELREGVVSVEADGHEQKLVAPAVWGCDASSQPVRTASAPETQAVRDDDLPPNVDANKTGKVASDRSTLAAETKLLYGALGAERQKDLDTAEKRLKQLLTQYPNSVVAPEARAALERIASKRVSERHR